MTTGNHLGDGGAETLASVLVSLTTLTHLDLSDNDISGVGLSHLVDVLRRSTANDPVSSLMVMVIFLVYLLLLRTFCNGDK